MALNQQLFAGPAPYTSAKIYILTGDINHLDQNGKPGERTAQNIRDWAGIIIQLNDDYTVDWFRSLHWENAKFDAKIKKKARPLVMVIDLYDRVQIDPAHPSFDTLYCDRNVAYSDEGKYISLSGITSSSLKLPLIKFP